MPMTRIIICSRKSLMGNLDVVIPPDIISDEETTDGGVAPENGSVRLRCKATGVPEPMVLWRREDSKTIVLRHDGGREKQGLLTTLVSRLRGVKGEVPTSEKNYFDGLCNWCLL
uniref:Ig-like domain-containing protein n=1 Tax=Timema tahoe TaxID=61484 RepID=A0A7R9IDK0_9NEOP|nr:unnamed protein product [Timema tahoe]